MSTLLMPSDANLPFGKTFRLAASYLNDVVASYWTSCLFKL